MTLKDRLSDDLKDAMRAKDAVRLGAVRMLRAAVLEREKSGAGEASDDDVLALVQKQAKQRRDAIDQFRAAGRDDLADKEASELAVIESYLPQQASDDEVRAVVGELIRKLGATGSGDMGRVMGPAMGALKGKAEGNRVRAAVEALLKG
jgi:hypothetical protein